MITQTHDTLNFSADAAVHACGEGRGVVVEGAIRGSGVLLWIRSGDTVVGGTYRMLPRGDSTTRRGAMAAVRFITRTNAERGVTLDSGVVTVSAGAGRKGVRVRGSGMDPVVGQRVLLDAAFDSVLMAPDTVSCHVQLQS